MKLVLHILILTLLLTAASSQCFALMDIEEVTKERAKELGMEIQSSAAGPDAVRVVLEFKADGALKDFSRVDLEISEGGKLLVSSSLLEDRSSPTRIAVSFAAGRAHLEKITVRVVTQSSPRGRIGYDLRVKDFIDPALLLKVFSR